ncbi:hypothetical protein Leryth_027077 [Lithospermum erythrorhizon]|nr:hypothetical protein Leryth_027077 [Lithospermum erythrorhizon]
MKNPIVCARRKKKLPILGSEKSRKQLFTSAYYIASKLKIVPEPLDFMIREYGVGNGGGGGGGSRWWKLNWSGGFDGWGRRRKKIINWKLWGCFAISVIIVRLVCLNFGGKLEIGEVWGVLGLSLFGCSVNGWWVNGMKDWALGFCCCVALFVWVLKRRDIEKWVKDFGIMKIVGKRRKKNFKW